MKPELKMKIAIDPASIITKEEELFLKALIGFSYDIIGTGNIKKRSIKVLVDDFSITVDEVTTYGSLPNGDGKHHFKGPNARFDLVRAKSFVINNLNTEYDFANSYRWVYQNIVNSFINYRMLAKWKKEKDLSLVPSYAPFEVGVLRSYETHLKVGTTKYRVVDCVIGDEGLQLQSLAQTCKTLRLIRNADLSSEIHPPVFLIHFEPISEIQKILTEIEDKGIKVIYARDLRDPSALKNRELCDSLVIKSLLRIKHPLWFAEDLLATG
jgi:hypothetical protein